MGLRIQWAPGRFGPSADPKETGGITKRRRTTVHRAQRIRAEARRRKKDKATAAALSAMRIRPRARRARLRGVSTMQVTWICHGTRRADGGASPVPYARGSRERGGRGPLAGEARPSFPRLISSTPCNQKRPPQRSRGGPENGRSLFSSRVSILSGSDISRRRKFRDGCSGAAALLFFPHQ